MGKTKYWLSILAISVVLIAGSLAVSPIAIADDDDDDDDDEPAKRAFEFEGATPKIEMEGSGDWVKMTTIIDAEGDFELSDGTEGEWKAVKLTSSCGGCGLAFQTTSGSNVVFEATFTPESGTPFTADVIVSDEGNEIKAVGTGGNFWVGDPHKSFGTAESEFSDDD